MIKFSICFHLSIRLKYLQFILFRKYVIKNLFGSMVAVAVAFQISFHAEMHANDVFHFLKIIFDISTSKRSKTYTKQTVSNA